jgi:hypothetical protein
MMGPAVASSALSRWRNDNKPTAVCLRVQFVGSARKTTPDAEG